VFGWTLDEERSFAVLDAYVESGGNFIDTADIYGRRGVGSGSSEEIIGRWLAARGNREGLVIATKLGMGQDPPGLSADAIERGAARSLERLGIDTIDLYYAHRDDPDTPLEETLGAFQRLIDAGSIRHAAASNYSAERLEQALELGEREGLARYVALQPHYNLMERRGYEGALQALCLARGLACLPYYALAGGFLTGKYRRDAPRPNSPRASGVLEDYGNDRGWAVIEAVEAIAAEHDSTATAVALAWLSAQPTVLAPIASATSPEQLRDVIASTDLHLTSAELDRLSTVSG
jgi:aryl-alcohol dehydrogenase-like predicted oxidoreductase